ncbi:FtsX-like permease family protein [Leucobacter sp. CSA2]|uniref:FtsX-like permease family protein n=1 Tax=Leucobacter edaphi TaxID=2796472 RepID=A0A934QD01_9MICO|nr:FtsX-like permease family protein [Leucobacter edaphi]MBK0421555.1 FtsX-like permease family protein [Leucobacter edaphi]
MILRLLPLLTRPSRQGIGMILLPGVAFATVTALLGIVIGGARPLLTYQDEMAGTYMALTVIALALLAMPLLTLGHAAARLATRRRDDRLAVLRLLGVTGRDTALLAVIESGAIALIGAVIGVGISYLCSPLIGLIHFRGEAIGAEGAALPPLTAVILVLSITLIAIVSAALSLRTVVVSPLGVAKRENPPKQGWIAAIAAVLLIVIVALILGQLGSLAEMLGATALILILGGGFALTLLAIDLIGGALLGVIARGRLKRAETPDKLIAARLVLENPKSAWRQVSGVAMASFMAVFAGSGIALLGMVGDEDAAAMELFTDMRTGIIITVIGSFIMVACSVGVNQASQILDRRDVERSLDIMGTPFAVQDRARYRATMMPLLLAALGSAAIAGVLLFPLVGATILIAPLSLLTILSTIIVGCAVVIASLLATKPLLRTTTQNG